jgi:cytolysin (calcineurin-like family phosphatase)
VIGGDMTDDAGGQVKIPGEGTQLLQFSHYYQQGVGGSRVRFPIYTGLGNHDLDQDGPPPVRDWYRNEMRAYVKLQHERTEGFEPPVPVTSYDAETDSYSWDWGPLHLVQTHRYPGDTTKGAINGLPWLERDLARYAGDGRPVILIQHYGWDPFSTERWDPMAKTYTSGGKGPPHWWGEEQWQAEHDVIKGYNVIGIFHGHEHCTSLVYRWNGIDVFKPKAAFLGHFAVVRVTARFMDVAFAEVLSDRGDLRFTGSFAKKLGQKFSSTVVPSFLMRSTAGTEYPGCGRDAGGLSSR